MTRTIRLLSTEVLQAALRSMTVADGPLLGFLRVVPTTGDDVRSRCFYMLDAEGCLKGSQPTLSSSCVPLLPTPFCTNHKPRVHNCGAAPL